MKILNTTEEQLEKALKLLNEEFENNVIWNREPEALNQGQTTFRLTLRVKDSKGKGHRLSQSVTSKGNRIRMISACWHAHGEFFDILFDLNTDIKIRTGQHKIDSKEDNWQDFNIGSLFNPLYYSEACEC